MSNRNVIVLLLALAGLAWWGTRRETSPHDAIARIAPASTAPAAAEPIRTEPIRTGPIRTGPDFDSAESRRIKLDGPQQVARSAAPLQDPSLDEIAADRCRLELTIAGVRPSRGELRLAVFSNESTFPLHERALRSWVVPVPESSSATAVLDDIPRGQYAVAVFQDENSDGVLNRGRLGVPTERYGFSRNARGTFGPPTFDAASVQLDRPRHEFSIQLK